MKIDRYQGSSFYSNYCNFYAVPSFVTVSSAILADVTVAKTTSNFKFQSTSNDVIFTAPDYQKLAMNINDPLSLFECSTYLQYD